MRITIELDLPRAQQLLRWLANDVPDAPFESHDDDPGTDLLAGDPADGVFDTNAAHTLHVGGPPAALFDELPSGAPGERLGRALAQLNGPA